MSDKPVEESMKFEKSEIEYVKPKVIDFKVVLISFLLMLIIGLGLHGFEAQVVADCSKIYQIIDVKTGVIDATPTYKGSIKMDNFIRNRLYSSDFRIYADGDPAYTYWTVLGICDLQVISVWSWR